MKLSLLKGTEEDKQEIKGLFIQSLRLRRVFIDVFEDKIRINAQERVANDYKDASWGFKQADKNGYERALREVISILTDDK